MRNARLLTTVLLTALAATNAFAAKNPNNAPAAPAQLFALDKAAQPPASRWLVPDEAEEFAIQTNPEAVARNPRAFTVDLPGLPPLEATRRRFVVYRADWKSWIGTLRRAGTGEPATGYIHLGYHGKQLSGFLEFEGERYRIVNLEAGHRLVRLSEELGTPSCGIDAVTEAAKSSRLGGEIVTPEEAEPSIVTKIASNRLDLLVVYPKAFFPLGPSAESGLVTFVQDSVSMANDVFVNSSVDAAYNLVGVVPVTGSSQPTSGIGSALTWLDGNPTEVANLRNAFGADIVTVFVPFSWNGTTACGIANLPQSNSTYLTSGGTVNAALGDHAFSANRVDCGLGDFTLGHEIGHNYGMRHDTDNTASPPALFPNGKGYLFTVSGQTKSTVMGCYCPGPNCSPSSSSVCNRVAYFSDPNLSYLGVPVGDSTHNNAAAGRTQVATYAGFRSQSANTPPTASFTTSCSGRTCTFTSTSTDNASIPSTGYWWDFGDSSAAGSGSSVSHTFPSYASYYVHLVVTDSGGQTGVKVNTVTPSPTYEGYLENANCRFLSGWAWDNTPNSPINVDIYRDGSFVTSISANAFRQDLVNAGKGNGAHGYAYVPDSGWKNGQWRSASVRFGGTATNLTWSPQNIICGVSCFPSLTPTENNDTAGVVYTVATQFSSTNSGYITHLRFYRPSGETGTNVGYLWSDSGTLLASATFPSTPSSGWVEVALSSPVAISASTRYRVGVNTNTRQSKTSCGIGSGITNQVLTAHQGFWIAGNGTFPTTSSCSNFFADVKFDL